MKVKVQPPFLVKIYVQLPSFLVKVKVQPPFSVKVQLPDIFLVKVQPPT